MLKENAEAFMALGEEMLDARLIYDMDEFTTKDSLTGHQKLTEEGKESLVPELQKLLALCKRLNLSTSSRLIGRRLGYQDSLPNSLGEFDLLMEVVRDELRSQLFLFVPQHVAEFYSSDTIVSEKAAESFPSAAQEIRNAGTCLAVGQYTASVFHSMRAAEIGVRSLALAMKVELKKPIEQAEWMDILNGLTGRIRDIENMPRGTPGRDEDLQFYSEASAQFRFFKNGWRVRVAHARATYDEQQAKDVLQHVRSFFEGLSPKLRE